MKPRVLMIAYACNPEGGGEHWLGWGWAEQAAREFAVHLITTPNSRAQVEKHAPLHGITPHFVGLPGWLRKTSSQLGGAGSWLRKLVWQYRVARLAAALHEREKFQIVHQTTFHTFRVPFLAARLDIPSVWGPIAGGESVPPGFARDLGAARAGEFLRRLVNRLWLATPSVRGSLQRASVVFVSNHTTLEFIPQGFRDKCVVVPPNALRPEDAATPFASSSHSPSTNVGQIENENEDDASKSFNLLYVGNCVATRALPLVFDALRHSGLDDWKLTVVGSGPALARWRRLVTQWSLSARVEFTGQLPRERVSAYYARADALVFPALRDSGGSALLEAMARGVPVICLDWGGPGEMVDASSGVKIPMRDRAETVAALAASFARLKALPDLRRALARAAQERAQTHFRWETKRALLVSTYQRLLS
jgi:glycosyltransferase involved in cell wall biosynthesis